MTLDNLPSINTAQKQSIKPSTKNRNLVFCMTMQKWNPHCLDICDRDFTCRPLLLGLGWKQVCCWSGTLTSPICVVQMLMWVASSCAELLLLLPLFYSTLLKANETFSSIYHRWMILKETLAELRIVGTTYLQ